RSEKVEKVLQDEELTISGKDNAFNFVPDVSGRYEIRVSAPGARSYVSNSFYAYGWGSTSNSSFEVNPEGQIDIELDKDSYEIGETANVILKSPFSGKVLVTLEADKIIKSFYVDADNRATSFKVDIEEDFVPNIYLTATLFKPHEQSDLPLTIAHGAAPILVEDPDNKLPLAIEAVEKSRSKTKQKIKIKSEPNTPVTVAVVDEGILQLTSYKTPDPYRYFYRKRALGVKSYDIYPFLFPEINITSGLAGGDGSLDAELAKRVNPLTNKRVKLVAFWSGILTTDGSGEAEYEIDIPQFSGDLRIMAVAHKGKAFAGTSANMKVADPLVVSTALPRFFSPGDTVVVPVVMTNTTEKSANCQTKISVTGPLTVLGGASQSVKIGAGSEGRAVYKVVADKAIGQSNVTIDINAMGESFKNSTDITVRPASPLQKVSGSGVVKSGDSKRITLAEDQFIKESIQRKLVVSNSPMVEFAEDLDYLVRYPYGCVEQTVSAVFPQLYYQELTSNLVKAADPNKVYNSVANINHAISKLRSMQLYDGSLTYWPGGGYVSWWGSVYAAHFLHEAGKAGFDVDQDFLSKLQGYLITQLKSRQTTYYYYNNTKRLIANKEIPYSLYVLALSGKAQRSTMNYYKGNKKELSLDGKYLLAAAYKLIGDDKSYRELLPARFEGEISAQSFSGSFYSYIRDEAIALNTLLDVDANNPQIPEMAKHLSKAMKTERYLNTQERTFGFLALGKIASANAKNKVTAKIRSNGKQVGEYNGETLTLTSAELSDGDVEIETSGNGNLYYFWNTEGINADGSYREEDSYLKVRRAFYDRNGSRIYDNNFKQNDLVVVMLTISTNKGEYVENVAMTDILPAGFEIENPRITEVPGTEWAANKAARPDHADIRDDRITFFLKAARSERKYFYVVRAVSKGKFQLGPVGADAMYDGEYHSYNGGGAIVVE
ncbi:MAG: alpha-2-macroglobulin family protein, partial [Bacteroidota bacterium]